MSIGNTYLREEVLDNLHMSAEGQGYEVKRDFYLTGRIYPMVVSKFSGTLCFDFISNYVNHLGDFSLDNISIDREAGVDMLVILDEWESTMYMYDLHHDRLLLPMRYYHNDVNVQDLSRCITASKRRAWA